MPKILISYRRSDSAGVTGRIFDRLVANYGKDSVFMDVDNIPFGVDFRQHIRTALLEADVLLVVMANAWLGRSESGGSRIQDPTDPVRVEVEAALQGGTPLIPILVDDARMPGTGDLPPSLHDFAFRNAAKVDQGRDFGYHVDRLIRSIDGILQGNAKAAAADPPPTAAAPPLAAEAPAPAPRPAPEPVAAPVSTVPPAFTVPPVSPSVSPLAQSVPPASPAAAQAAPQPSRFPWIRNPQDFYGGLALIGLALIALWASSDLPGMRGFAFGPGTAPRMFAILLGLLGAGVSINGLVFEGPEVGRYDIMAPILISTSYVFFLFAQGLAAQVFTGVVGVGGVVVAVIGLLGSRRTSVRGPLFITISVIVFAATVRPLGLVVSSFVTIMICAAAAEDVRWRETILVAIALTLFCSLLFPYGLNLPMPLWPWFWR